LTRPHTLGHPLPVIVVTGTLGVGKTTAIAAALAGKPAQERWVVILNEFTDSGIDVLTVAGAARGEFDVRLVTGGCLCCVGAEDFSRTLEGFVRGPRPARLYIEPSGLGHPALIIEELLAYEARGEVELVAVVALVDAQHLDVVQVAGTARDQVDAADVVLLAKADQVSAAQRARFSEWAQSLYPPKRLVGECRAGQLPSQLEVAATGAAVTAERGAGAVPLPEYVLSATDAATGPRFAAPGGARSAHHLGRHALSFTFPAALAFDEQTLVAAVASATPLAGVARLKGVFRTGPSAWMLVHRTGATVSLRESAWRRDSRVELLGAEGVRLDRDQLMQFWSALGVRPGCDRR